MNHYEEGINAMGEEVEGKKSASAHRPSEEERWKKLIREYSHSNCVVNSEFGVIDMADNAMEDVHNGENLTYDEYLQAMFNSRNERRYWFEHAYYNYASCYFKGQISKFKRSKGKVVFDRIYVSGMYMDGEGFEGKEDHVWMDSEPFESFQVGDSVSFGGEIYRYLKIGRGKKISFGIREPYDISKVPEYERPSDEALTEQAIDAIICELCLFRDHCYMGMCIANQEWREEIRKTLLCQNQPTTTTTN